jgi:hypothetical protein
MKTTFGLSAAVLAVINRKKALTRAKWFRYVIRDVYSTEPLLAIRHWIERQLPYAQTNPDWDSPKKYPASLPFIGPL